MKYKIIGVCMGLLLCSINAFADIPANKDDLAAFFKQTAPTITWLAYRGKYENTMPVHAGAATSLMINQNLTDFVYNYRNKKFPFKGQISKAGGTGSAVINWDLPNGDHLRFEWLDYQSIRVDFWLKGTKAGQTKNNPPSTSAYLGYMPVRLEYGNCLESDDPIECERNR